MNLDPLVKPMYSTQEVSARWQTIHKDYDMEFLQEKIASGQIKANLALSDCYLFPAKEIDNSYQYLEFYDPFIEKGIDINPVHSTNEVVKKLNINHIFFSAFVSKARSNFENVNKTEYVKAKQKPSLGEIRQVLVTEIDLDAAFMSPEYLVIDSCIDRSETPDLDNSQYLNNITPIIQANCVLPVTPYFWKEPFGISFIPPSSLESLQKINLSTKDRSINEKVALVSVVEWRGNFYYIVNKNTINYDGEEINCFSLSSDALNSFQDGRGVVITKKELEKFENEFFFQNSQTLFSNEENTFTLSSREKTLNIMLSLTNDFGHSKEFSNQGVKTEQGFIESWIRGQPYDLKDHHIRTLKELISERYGITTGRRK